MKQCIKRIRNETVGRHTVLKRRWIQEDMRAYRFPRPITTQSIRWYSPHRKYGMCDRMILRAQKRNRAWLRKVNRATKRLIDMDIKRIDVCHRSSIMRITLLSDPIRIIDYGNRWERIERVFEEIFELRIVDHPASRIRWWY